MVHFQELAEQVCSNCQSVPAGFPTHARHENYAIPSVQMILSIMYMHPIPLSTYHHPLHNYITCLSVQSGVVEEHILNFSGMQKQDIIIIMT